MLRPSGPRCCSPAHGVITCRGSISRNRRASCMRRAGPHQLDGPVSGACPPAGRGVRLGYMAGCPWTHPRNGTYARQWTVSSRPSNLVGSPARRWPATTLNGAGSDIAPGTYGWRARSAGTRGVDGRRPANPQTRRWWPAGYVYDVASPSTIYRIEEHPAYRSGSWVPPGNGVGDPPCIWWRDGGGLRDHPPVPPKIQT